MDHVLDQLNQHPILARIKSKQVLNENDKKLLNDIKLAVEKILDKKLQKEISVNRCIVCNTDLGEANPRQYCCKTYCPFEYLEEQ